MFAQRECKSISSLLWDFARHKLSTDDAKRVEEHIHSCGRCNSEARRHAKSARLFEDYNGEAFPAPPAAWQDLRRRIELESSQPVGRPALVVRPIAVFAGLVLLAALAIGISLLPRSNKQIHLPINTNNFAFTPPGPVNIPRNQKQSENHNIPLITQERRVVNQPLPEKTSVHNDFTAPYIYLPNGADVVINHEDDLLYMNANSVVALAGWNRSSNTRLTALIDEKEKTFRAGDDFVYVPRPNLDTADATPEQQKALLNAAIIAYQREKEITDTRLDRNVSLGVKAAAFTDFCEQLKEKTGIDISARRGVGDEKITAFCDDLPVRDIMRQVTHVFGYTWGRSGEEGKYKYVLLQDLRSQLTEEEMRNHDINEALIDIDNKIADAKWDKKFMQWGAIEVYKQLSQDDLATLRKGGTVQVSAWSTDPAHKLSEDIDSQLKNAFEIGPPGSRFGDEPDTHVSIDFHINPSELGQLSLEAGINEHKVVGGKPTYGYGHVTKLAVGKSPSIAKPDNAEGNKEQRISPSLLKEITIRPTPSCPMSAETIKKSLPAEQPKVLNGQSQESQERLNRVNLSAPHVVSADVWEEVYKKTGTPIVADSYTRLYNRESVTIEHASVFEALCKLGDTMGIRWRKEGKFLQFRTTSFFWDKLKEVPNRYLVKWKTDSEMNQGMPFEDFLEMSALSDQQLDSKTVGDAVTHCWGLHEWDALLRPIGYYTVRPFARILAKLSPDLRRKFQEPEGVAFSSLSPAVQQEFTDAAKSLGPSYLDPNNFPTSRYRFDYVPAGRYVWRRGLDHKYQLEPLVHGKTIDEALTAARKIDPSAPQSLIVKTEGSLTMIEIKANGEKALVAGLKNELMFNPYGPNP